MSHGTLNCYVNKKCRCGECKRAWAVYIQQRREVARMGNSKTTWASAIRAINKIKSGPCSDCGGKFPSVCMDFDHVRGEKAFNISQFWGRSLTALVLELDKCELVCSNCHRIRTRNRKKALTV